jgi:hypothetical protein
MTISRASIGRQTFNAKKRKPAFGSFKTKLNLSSKKKPKAVEPPRRVRRPRRAKRTFK